MRRHARDKLATVQNPCKRYLRSILMSIRSIAARAAFADRTTSPRSRRVTAVVLAAVIAHSATAAAHAQNVGGRSEVFAGSELESYLRYMQTAGKTAEYPWSMRSFSPFEIDELGITDTAHPWATRYDLQKKPKPPGMQWDYVRPKLSFYLNTAFAYGGNDGAVWQGKGLTTAMQGGLAFRWRAFSASITPVAFRAENQSFPLMANGETGRLSLADGQWAQYVDRPQRFGTTPYGRIDLGQSWLRVDGYGIAVGVSTANEWWGPSNTYPYILGNNAPGFPHVFLGTSKPANIWIAKLHTRVFYGDLDQSAYSSVTGPDYFKSFPEPGKKRFMAGIVGILQPRGAPGLEIGGTRFFHAANDALGYSFSTYDLKLPLQGLLKRGLPVQQDTFAFGTNQALKENQLASLFLRWAPPSRGLDVYAEYGREDHSLDRRDLILEPDHSGSMNIGFRKVWVSPRMMHAVRGEVFTYEAAGGSRTRGEGQTYLHGVLRQGHTQRGQMLGANVGAGSGSAQIFAVDRFNANGRMTAFYSREVQHELRFPLIYRSGPPIEKAVDAIHTIGAEVNRFFGPFDVLGRTLVNIDLNRFFLADRTNLNFALEVRQNF